MVRRLLIAGGVIAALMTVRVAAQDIVRGRIVDEVRCAADPAHTYALYVPSGFSADRSWPLMIALHPAARGRAMVERYQAAAETYGYIVAGSNNSRNGPMQASVTAVQAMTKDLGSRFPIDPNRLYFTGMSGGARVAMEVALASGKVAGVIASSAGYPDAEPRRSVPFAVFSTAGTEDFNYLEMRRLDRALTSPHRLRIFEGGHTLPPADLTADAIEWLELEAMKSGRRTRDEPLIARLFANRLREADAQKTPKDAALALDWLATDFAGLRDVTAIREKAAALMQQKDVKAALKKDQDDENAEARLMNDVADWEAGLRRDETRLDALGGLRTTLVTLSRQAKAAADSIERRRARRVLRAIAMGASGRVADPEYLKLIEQYRLPGFGGG
jgi:predicted esterase